MSGRSRGRANPNQDADEERRLWKDIKDKARDVDAMVARSNDIGKEIIEVENQQAALLEVGKPTDSVLDDKLEKLYRENIKICEEVAHVIEGKSSDMSLLENIHVLQAVRDASETAAAEQASQSQRAASGKLARAPKKAGSKSASAIAASTEDGDEASAAPSPRITLTANRLSAKEKTSRSGSITTTREASVKIEDGAESVASSADGQSTGVGAAKPSAGGSRPSNRLVLRQGEIVFCRHDTKNVDVNNPPEGEGILCRVTSVIGEGKQRRYEVQDADTQGDPPPPQRASVSQLIQIPESNKRLGDLPAKKNVLAQYPDTTTFYKAEVSKHWKGADLGSERGEMVTLIFQEDEAPREVERRFVLTEK